MILAAPSLAVLFPPKRQSGFACRGIFTVTRDSALLPSTQSNFAVLVSLTHLALRSTTYGGFVTSSTSGIPNDLVFYSDTGLTTKLNYEVVAWSAITGALEAWVSISSLVLGSVFYAGVGNPSITTFQGNITGTWNSAYVLSAHLPDGTTLTALDSTSNANNGTLVNTPAAVAAVVGGGAAFVAASDQYINFGTAASLQITGNISVSAWAYLATDPGVSAGYQFLSKDKDSGGRAFTFDYYRGVTKNLRFYINGGGGNDIIISGDSPFSTGAWYHVAATWELATKHLNLYIDGALAATQVTTDTAAIPSATANVLLGRREFSGFTEPMNGRVDELRISNVVRSADWLLTERNNQNSPGAFVRAEFMAA